MRRYTKSVALYETSSTKIPDEGAQVKVYLSTIPQFTTLATLFSDDDGTVSLSQPFLTNTLAQQNPGQFTFVVDDGIYDIVVNENLGLTNQSVIASEKIFSQAVIPVIPVLPDIDIDNIRYSKLQNPLLSILKKNKLEDVIAGSLTWTRSTTATYVDRYGIIQTAAIDEPRQEAAGWLSEGTSENLCLRSEEFDNAVYSKNGAAVVTANTEVSPDGTTTADSVAVASGGVGDSLIQSISITGTTQIFTTSLYVKNTGLTKIQLRIVFTGGGTVDIRGDFDIVAKTYTPISGTPTNSKIETINNEWVRISLSGATLATSTVAQFRFSDSELTPGTGDFIVWGSQTEELPFASSYIPTVASSVVRGADMVTVDVSENLPALSEDFSLTVCYKPILLTATTQRFVDTTGSNLLLQSLSTGAVQFGGSGTFSTSSVSPTNDIDVALVSENGETTLYFNGLDDSPAPIPYVTLGTGSIHIGAGNSGIVPCYGHFLSFHLYDFALNADEVKFIS